MNTTDSKELPDLSTDEGVALWVVAQADSGEPEDYTVGGTGIYGYGTEVSCGDREWSVMTDREADCAMSDALDSYLDDCILPDLPEQAQRYFDREAWKSDASTDGRGHILSSYDGNEYEYQLPNGDYVYVYRTN